ncbi:hypothetical protein [Ferrimonas lipolytica]|uniref:Uncharacterized protein n=1 Tax=Ferrimonas lipolytica TaxID=2724191 RepID=A0A6H1UCB6_9GAMM|nr:hypothetical protein [Ferrimonas lipolytica]QIZ75452.1 hypothetical protein HER31_00150 [Ferrimonas lipolytica]
MGKAVSDFEFYVLRLGKTTLRAAHVLGVMGGAGGFLFGLESELWRHWWILAMSSGCLLLAWEIWRSPMWLVQLKGACTIGKIILLALCYPFPALAPWFFSFIALLSVFIAHGPSQFRHYSLWHRKVLRGKEIKG